MGIIKVYFYPNAKIEAATAQVTAIAQTALRSMPLGSQPPLIIQYNASNVPILQLGLGSDKLSEQQLFDYGTQFIRTGLITVQGAQIPWPYGGKQRQIMVDLDPERLYAWGISPSDVSNAISAQNLVLPAGTTKIGTQEYAVHLNSSPTVVDTLNDLPIKTVNGTTVYIKDVAHVRDGFSVQTSIVHADGKRRALMVILKNGGTSTLDIVRRIKAILPAVAATVPASLKITPLFDQSIFVRASVDGVVKEAAIAAGLTGLMILLFLGSWRSTLIVVISIPLSILVSIIVLYFLGQTLNVMTLGGMALAVGILVDDATVAIENIHRNIGQGKPLLQRHPRRLPADRRARLRLHLVHLHRLRARGLHYRSRQIPLHAAGHGRRLCDDDQLRPESNAGSHPHQLSPARRDGDVRRSRGFQPSARRQKGPDVALPRPVQSSLRELSPLLRRNAEGVPRSSGAGAGGICAVGCGFAGAVPAHRQRFLPHR